MLPPRVAFASGLAALAGAAVLLSGRIPGSAATALVLALAARAAASAASDEPPAARSLARQLGLVPVWVAILVVASVRAGSGDLAAIRGANAVAGLAIASGGVLSVIAAWAALTAGTIAIWFPSEGTHRRGALVSRPPVAYLEAGAIGLHIALLATFFAGPQIREAADAVPWIVTGGLGTVAWLAAGSRAASPRVRWIAILVAAAAVVLVLAGERI